MRMALCVYTYIYIQQECIYVYIYIVCTYMHVCTCPFLLILIAPDAHGPSDCAHTHRLHDESRRDDESQHRNNTGWARLIGCLQLRVIFCKRATNYRALLRKMTYKHKASYRCWPPCMNTASGLALLISSDIFWYSSSSPS